MRSPVRELPNGYHEAEHLVVTDEQRLLKLNLLSLIPTAISLIAVLVWGWIIQRTRGPIPGGPEVHWLVGIVLILVITLPLHEGLHGLTIRLIGHKVRYGMKLDKGVLYATADNALFRRNEFIAVALAPLVVISLLGMALMWLLPDSLGFYTALAIVLNAGSAIGDLWMTVVVLRYPPDVLVRDEADAIRIFMAG